MMNASMASLFESKLNLDERMAKEINSIQQLTNSIKITQDLKDSKKWLVSIIGPHDTPYAGREF